MRRCGIVLCFDATQRYGRAVLAPKRSAASATPARVSLQESKGVQPIASEPHRLPSDRADEVELKLRARAEQIKATEQRRSTTTAIGLCHACGRTVRAADGLAMAGMYLVHAACCPPAADSAKVS